MLSLRRHLPLILRLTLLLWVLVLLAPGVSRLRAAADPARAAMVAAVCGLPSASADDPTSTLVDHGGAACPLCTLSACPVALDTLGQTLRFDWLRPTWTWPAHAQALPSVPPPWRPLAPRAPPARA